MNKFVLISKIHIGDHSPAAPLLLPAANSLLLPPISPGPSGSTTDVHQQLRCCSLPRTHRYPTDVTWAVSASTEDVHQQPRCCPLPRAHRYPTDVTWAGQPPPRMFTSSSAAAPYRGPTATLPMTPGPSGPPRMFTSSSAAAPIASPPLPHRFHPGHPAPTEDVHQQLRCCPYRGPTATLPMTPGPSGPPRMFTSSSAAAPYRWPTATLTITPGPSGPPRMFTSSSAAAPYRGPTDTPPMSLGRSGLHRGCSPAAPLLHPIAGPPLTHRDCCCLQRTRCCPTDVARMAPATSADARWKEPLHARIKL